MTERVQEFVDAGARHIIFTVCPRTDRQGMMRRVMDEVVPKNRP